MSTRLEEEFSVALPPGETWRVLLDAQRVVPCVPGARLDSREGDTCIGRLQVRTGPVTVTYRGKAELVRRDDTARVAVIEAKGKEARGSGTAEATVTVSLHENGAGTRIRVDAEVTGTGRITQTGRDLARLGARMMARFAGNLTRELSEGPAGSTVAAEAAAPVASSAQTGVSEKEPRGRGPAVWEDQGPQDEALDLIAAAGRPALVRAAVAAGALLVALILLHRLLGRRRRRRSGEGAA